MLTIVESESNTWFVVATGGKLRIYSRDRPEEWSELMLSDDSEEVEEEKALMLEELYVQRTGDEEPGHGEDESGEDEEDDENADEPELEEEDSGEDEEDDENADEAEEEEEEEKPARGRRATATAKRGRASSRQK